MVRNDAGWRIKAQRAMRTIAAALPLFCFTGSAAQAQSIMRSPNLNIESRVPGISVAPRINGDVAGRAINGIGRMPVIRSGPRLGSSACDDGGCGDQPVVTGGGGNGGTSASKRGNRPRRGRSQTTAASDLHAVANQIVAEIDGSLSGPQADELARRHRLVRLQSQNFPLIGATIGLFRITDRRTVEAAGRELGTEAGVRSVQPNFRYVLQDQKTALTEGDPGQYALAKLRLPEAHTLAHGANVTIAVIDSGIDARHPELANAIVANFDAIDSKEGPHAHGTGVAGAIVSHARLMGSAPAARILAIRAFSATPGGAESTSFVVLKALDYAAANGAQIVNMSFAGPKDALVERGIAAVAARGIVMVAASGNAGAKSPPLYPAADANVIAVSATDAHDRLFSASNRGSYIAVAAPGVDIFLPAPDGKYQMTSGTSFSAAFVSGVVALLLERNPALKPAEVRAIVIKTARDLGAPGRDDLFGAGEADAYAAVSAVAPAALPVAAASDPRPLEKIEQQQDVPPTRAPDMPPPAMAADKPADGPGRP